MRGIQKRISKQTIEKVIQPPVRVPRQEQKSSLLADVCEHRAGQVRQEERGCMGARAFKCTKSLQWKHLDPGTTGQQ